MYSNWLSSPAPLLVQVLLEENSDDGDGAASHEGLLCADCVLSSSTPYTSFAPYCGKGDFSDAFEVDTVSTSDRKLRDDDDSRQRRVGISCKGST